MSSLREAILRTQLRRSLPPPEVRRDIRQRAGVSQRTLADELGVTRATVSRWEAGRRTPAGPLLAHYSEVLQQLTAECSHVRHEEDPAGRPGLVEQPARQGRHETG